MRFLLAALFVALAVWGFVFKAARKMPDFEVYWRAGARAAAAEPLYRVEDGHFQLKYLPGFAVVAIPFGWLPVTTAKAVWYGVSVALLVLLIRLNLRLLPEQRKRTEILVAIMIVAFAKFYARELVLGQVNMLFAVLTTGALVAMKTEREATAGALAALAILVKPYAVLLLPWLAARRRAASVLTAGGGLAVALVLPAVVYGFEGNVALHADWWRTVTDTTAPNLSSPDNVSLAAMYIRWFGPGPIAMWLALATGVLLLGLMAVVFLGRKGVAFPEGVEGALLLTLMPLLSPQGWDYVFLIATPAVALLGNYEDRLPRALRLATIAALATIGLSLFDLAGRAAYAAFMRLSIITLCFLVVIAALACLRFRKVA